MNPISALILSDKSSGSSVLQRELAKHSAVNIMRKPHHQENETLFWSKAAAVLDLPQPAMIDSSILPMSRPVASEALDRLLRDNLAEPGPTPTTASELFASWHQLATTYGPVFLEKSPHHLHNRAVLELLLDARRELTDIDFRFVGLVRNPVDTMYSMWKRWKIVPEARESEWCRAYGNLLWLKETAPAQTSVVRYEDLIADPEAVTALLDFVGVGPEPAVGTGFRSGSLQSWRSDSGFGYQPSSEVRRIASHFGYTDGDLDNAASRLWPFRRIATSAARRARTWVGSLRRN
jgi:uncharacterized protein YceK